MEGLSPRKGSKSAPQRLQYRINVQLAKPVNGDGTDVETSPEVTALFVGGAKMVAKGFTFNAALDSTLTPEALSDILYAHLAEKQDEIIAEHSPATAEATE